MTIDNQPDLETESDSSSTSHSRQIAAPRKPFHWRYLVRKELRETLRDRRTIVTLVVMPLLVYPILSLMFRSFLMSQAGLVSDGKPIRLTIVFSGEGTQEQVIEQLMRIGATVEGEYAEQTDSNPQTTASAAVNPAPEGTVEFALFSHHGWVHWEEALESMETLQSPPVSIHDLPANQPDQIVEQLVAAGIVDVGLVLGSPDDESGWIAQANVVARNDARSRSAARYLNEQFEQFNQLMLDDMLRRAGLPDRPAIVTTRQIVGDAEEDTNQVSLAALIPLILVLMTITGAVYPAIDLTAGEKERGTLETLMAAPLPRFAILSGKFVAVMTVAVLTAMLNLVGMLATVWAFQLDRYLIGAGEFTPTVVANVFMLLVLFAAFFSAVLLAVTSYARSFKEAQAYLIPIILLSLGPGLLAMTPGMKLEGFWAVTPMVNLLLLARDVIQGTVAWWPAIVAVLSTMLYGVLAMAWAARSFGSDAILYQDQGSFGEMFSRPRRTRDFIPISAMVFCVVLLFPLNFVLIGLLGRMAVGDESQLTWRFLMMAVFTVFSFLLLPWGVAAFQKARTRPVFGLNRPRVVYVLAALILGVSLWPLVMGLTEGWQEIYGWLAGSEARDVWRERLVQETSAQIERVRQVSPVVIAVCLSIVPAICEEWFFRGMVLRSLSRTRSAATAIVVSAVVFGLFHVLSNSVIAIDRFVPTMMVGLVLGYLAYKSDSILPGILLHAIHNAAVAFLGYYQPQLSRLEWFPGESESIPITWIAVAAVVAAGGMGLARFASPEKRESSEM